MAWSRGSSVTTSRLRPGRQRFIFRQEQKILPFATASTLDLWPTQSPIQYVPWTFSPEVKRPEREADHSPPSSAEIKNVWSYISPLSISLHGLVLNEKTDLFTAWYLVKHRDYLTFSFTVIISYIKFCSGLIFWMLLIFNFTQHLNI